VHLYKIFHATLYSAGSNCQNSHR